MICECQNITKSKTLSRARAVACSGEALNHVIEDGDPPGIPSRVMAPRYASREGDGQLTTGGALCGGGGALTSPNDLEL